MLELVNLIHDYLRGRERDYLPPFLTDWPTPPFSTRSFSPNTLPVLEYLSQIPAAEDDPAAAIIRTLKQCVPYLQWGQTYQVDDFGAAFLQKYGWTELIGLRGPIPSDKIACGFLLLGPHIQYPKHSHAAAEIYVPFSEPSWWLQDDDTWLERPRGVPIYHRPWLPHGMHTREMPLLALYLWCGGDLAQKSHIYSFVRQ